ncbi:SOS response-associated peptidase [Rhodospirillales bacterium]|nr:SOS response-associated peptidase [Rhodospirillales bacterium]
MCARYEYKTLVSDLMEAYDLPEAPALPNQSEIRPTDVAVVVHQDRTTATQPWGFQVDWTKQPMINARAETLTEKPTFRPWLQSRCIVPASAYFEWRTDDLGKKRKNRIWLPDDSMMSMAGLTDGERFTIVTCTPSRAIEHIHSRMPVVLAANDVNCWLSDDPFDQVMSVLQPYGGVITFDEEKPPPPAQQDLFG